VAGSLAGLAMSAASSSDLCSASSPASQFDLAAAVAEAKADYAAGRYNRESVEDHIKQITDAL
jgi:hypothetical protein